MSTTLESARFVWDIIKDGGKVETEGKVVNVLPKGKTKDDFDGWKGPISYQERFEALSFLSEDRVAEFAFIANWEFNGKYISNFNILVEGRVDVLSNIDVKATTLEAHINEEGMAELPYHIEVTFHNLTGGTKRTTYRAVARGDGSGMSFS